METVPGSPQGILELARHWTRQADSADDSAITLRSAKNDIEGGALGLKGDFAPKIRDAIGDLPNELEKLGRGYRGCGKALQTFATNLTQAQTKARQAGADYDTATRSKRNAEYDLDALAPGWDVWAHNPYGLRIHLADKGEPVLAVVTRREKADKDVDLAESLARQAAALRGEAERNCVRDIKNALEDSGLQNRKWYQKVGDYLKESFTTWDGFVKLCETISTVLGVIAIFLSGPLALVVGAIILAAAVVAMADKIKKFANGEIGWKELAFEAGMVVAARFGGRALGPAFRRLSNTKTITAFSKQAHKGADRLATKLNLGDRGRNVAHRAVCTVTGHPVDIATGKLFTDFTDLELPGPLPFTLERVWYSTSTYAGPFGHGWHHTFDAALYVSTEAALYRTPDGRSSDLLPLDVGAEYYDRLERLTVARDGAGYRITGSDGITRRFAPSSAPADLTTASSNDVVTVTYVLSDVINRSGQRISLRYEGDRLVEIVDSGGRVLGLAHDDDGRVVSLTAPHPAVDGERYTVARYAYDAVGNLTSMTDALGQVFSYEYEGHLLVRETNRTGLSFYFEFDGADEKARCLHTWGDGGIYDHRLTYDIGETTVVNSLGHVTRYEHENGLVIRSADALGGVRRTRFDYQQPVEEIDPLSRVTTYAYDHRGNLVETVTPDGATIRATFDHNDLPVTAVDAVGGEWRWSYDDAGLLSHREDPVGASSTFTYRSGLLVGLTDPAGGVTALSYDDQGSLNSVITPDGAVSGWRRNAVGWPIVAVDALGNEQRREFDLAGRVVRVDEPDGNLREMEYDGEGNVLHAVDRLYDVKFTYSGMGRMATRTQAGTTVRFEYDTEEQLTGIVNEHGYAYGFTLGATGEVTVERGFDDIRRFYEYDVAGRVVQVRRASGIVTRYGYDPVDRVTKVEHSDGTGETFTYRADGALMSAVNRSCTVEFERDTLGRVLRESQDGRWVVSEYDVMGLRVRMHSSMGADVAISRNAMGDVTSVVAGEFVAQFERDALGQELSRSLPGGVRARWHRDHLGRPIRHEVTGATGVVRDRLYDWGVDGRLQGVADALGGPIRYEHDALGQLVSATRADGRVELRMPDAVGNLFRTEDRSDRRYGPAGQLLESIDEDGRRIELGYDAEGNLTSKGSSAGESWAYHWGADGYLASVVRPDSSVVSFTYDVLGRRVSKTYRGEIIRWVWDGDVVLHEWADGALATTSAIGSTIGDTLGSLVTSLFVPESFTPLALLALDRCEVLITDHIGLPVLSLTELGEEQWRRAETDLGDRQARSGPFQWPGQYEDVETGLFYNGFRYYDSETGRYITQDPLGVGGGIAVYAYVSDPLVDIDPLGLRTCGTNHGNHKDSGRLSHRYVIVDIRNKSLYKTGVSSGRLNKNGSSRRANVQVNALNRRPDGKHFKAVVVETDRSRREVLDSEEAVVRVYMQRTGGELPPGMERPSPRSSEG